MYTVLGCLVESIGMLVITVPLLFPVLLQYGIDPIWFGVILVLLIELGQITPPLGINLFVIQGIARCNLGEVVRGTLPYYLIILAFVALLAWVPEIALWLPNNMPTR
jgi:TRAP-type C4-dicarboxylate transport system permease large subunit